MKTLYTPENAPLFNKLYKQIIDKKIIQLWFGSKNRFEEFRSVCFYIVQS